MVMVLPLTQGFQTTIDDEDYPICAGKSLYVFRCPNHAYARFVGDDGVVVLLHRVISGAVPGQVVDHIDGDGTNNRRSNLRIATQSENLRNQSIKSGKRLSRYKGVHLCAKGKHRTTWRAMIWVDGKNKCVSPFNTEAAAALAYDELARNYYGEFACVNFPRDGERAAVSYTE